MGLVYLIIASLVLMAIVVVLGKKENRKQDNLWESVANDLGLQLERDEIPPNCVLSGTLDGVGIHAEMHAFRHGVEGEVATICECQLGAMAPDDLHLYREGLKQKVGKVLGGQDIQVDDPEIDAAFIIRGTDAALVTRVLTEPSVKRALVGDPDRRNYLEIEVGFVRLKRPRRPRDADELEGDLRAVTEITRAIDNACSR